MKYLVNALLLIIALLGVYYASQAMTIDKIPNSVSLSAQLSKKAFYRGESAFLDIIVSNKSLQVVRLWETLPARDFEIEIKTSKGLSVPLTNYGQKVKQMGRIYKNMLISLKTGETYTPRIEISKSFDLSTPGTYSIKVKRTVFDQTGKKPSILTSNIAVFSVTE